MQNNNSLIGKIKYCFLSPWINIVNYRGRSRIEEILGFLLLMPFHNFKPIMIILSIAFISFVVRRFHDHNLAGRQFLILAILLYFPIINYFSIFLLLYIVLINDKPTSNKYGEPFVIL